MEDALRNRTFCADFQVLSLIFSGDFFIIPLWEFQGDFLGKIEEIWHWEGAEIRPQNKEKKNPDNIPKFLTSKKKKKGGGRGRGFKTKNIWGFMHKFLTFLAQF